MPGPTNRAWVPNVPREADGGSRRATIVATGSEVAIALKARSLLQSEGVPTAVVSMPCWELFDEQPEHYRLQSSIAAPFGSRWKRPSSRVDRYVGEDGRFVGMSAFGASGAEDQLFAHFGLTPERAAEEVRIRL